MPITADMDELNNTVVFLTEAVTHIEGLTPYSSDDHPVNTFWLEVRASLIFRAALGIQRYWPPFIVTVGMMGNLLAVLVMTRPKNWRISCCVYMVAVAVSDSVMLSFLGYYWFMTEIFVDHRVNSECKGIAWGFQAFSLTGTILILLMTLDRLLAVRHPLLA